MTLYEYRERARNAQSIAWEVLELDLDTAPYTVQEHLTDRERADFREQFLSAGYSVDTF